MWRCDKNFLPHTHTHIPLYYSCHKIKSIHLCLSSGATPQSGGRDTVCLRRGHLQKMLVAYVFLRSKRVGVGSAKPIESRWFLTLKGGYANIFFSRKRYEFDCREFVNSPVRTMKGWATQWPNEDQRKMRAFFAPF